MRITALIVIAAGACWLAPAAPGPAEDKPAPVDFRREVFPLLDAKCNRCHGAKEKKGGLDLRTREAMLKGGNTGAALEPGKADKSLLVELIHFNEMPPKKVEPRVTKDELGLLKRWIDEGAPGGQ